MNEGLANLRLARESYITLYLRIVALTQSDPATVWAFLCEERERFGAQQAWIEELAALWLNLLDNRPEARGAILAEEVLLALLPSDAPIRLQHEQAILRYWLVYDLPRAEALVWRWLDAAEHDEVLAERRAMALHTTILLFLITVIIEHPLPRLIQTLCA